MIGLHAEIIFGAAGQSITFMAPDGRPTAIDLVSLIPYDADDDSGTAVTLSGTAISGVSTTVSSESGDGTSDPTLVHLASATGLKVDGTYLIRSTIGETEWVTVSSISGNDIHVRSPLRNSYALGSVLEGTTISASFPDSIASDKSKITSPLRQNSYRVRWVYTGADGVKRTAQTTVAVVRYQTRNPVLPVHIDARFPGWLERIPTDYRSDQGKSLIESAFEAVRIDIRQEGQVDHANRDPDGFASLIIHKTLEIAAEVAVQFGGGSAESLVAAREGYTERLNRLIRQPSGDVQTSEGGASQIGKKLPFWSR